MAIMIDEKIGGGSKEIHNIPMNIAYNKAKSINCSEILTSADNTAPNCKTKNKGVKTPKN